MKLPAASVSLAIAAAAVWFLSAGCGGNDDNDNGGHAASTGSITPSGGTVAVSDGNSPVAGVKVEADAGAVVAATPITIAASPSSPALDTDLQALSPVVQFGPDGTAFNVPVKVTIPVPTLSNMADSVVMALIYDPDRRRWSVAPAQTADPAKGTVSFRTVHFSEAVVARVDTTSIPGHYDTGFVPAQHGFFIDNFSYGGRGHCAGLVAFAEWYFENREQMCNDLYTMGNDASSAVDLTELAIAAQTKTRDYTWFNWEIDIQNDMVLGWPLFCVGVQREMARSGQPVIVLKVTTKADGSRTGHALLAYGYDQTAVKVYDPNYPGEARTITRTDFDSRSSAYFAINSSQLYFAPDMEAIFEQYKALLCPSSTVWEIQFSFDPGTVSTDYSCRTRTSGVGCECPPVSTVDLPTTIRYHGVRMSMSGQTLTASSITWGPYGDFFITNATYDVVGTMSGNKVSFSLTEQGQILNDVLPEIFTPPGSVTLTFEVNDATVTGNSLRGNVTYTVDVQSDPSSCVEIKKSQNCTGSVTATW